MPYIDQERRNELVLRGQLPESGAELNFLFCDHIDSFLFRVGLSYANLAEVDAALSLAQFEFRRRIVAPYEDQKAKDHGEVFVGTLVPPERGAQRGRDDVSGEVDRPRVPASVRSV